VHKLPHTNSDNSAAKSYIVMIVNIFSKRCVCNIYCSVCLNQVTLIGKMEKQKYPDLFENTFPMMKAMIYYYMMRQIVFLGSVDVKLI
jgi:hypothetical protein